MKTSFEIIESGFARPILGNHITGNPIKDAMRSLTMNHQLHDRQAKSGKEAAKCRLNKWAIFRASGSTLATDIKAYPGGDDRKSTDAFVNELLNLSEPCVFVIFSKALITPETLRATYDPRRVSICHPDGVTVIDVTDPEAGHPLARAYQKEIRQNAA